jgi:hypothetical protein
VRRVSLPALQGGSSHAEATPQHLRVRAPPIVGKRMRCGTRAGGAQEYVEREDEFDFNERVEDAAAEPVLEDVAVDILKGQARSVARSPSLVQVLTAALSPAISLAGRSDQADMAPCLKSCSSRVECLARHI